MSTPMSIYHFHVLLHFSPHVVQCSCLLKLIWLIGHVTFRCKIINQHNWIARPWRTCHLIKGWLLLLQIEDLKLHLQSCHQQLIDSNNHKQLLEQQLRTALEREQDIRTGYISPVSNHSLCFQYAAALDGKSWSRFHVVFTVKLYFFLHFVTFFACCILL